ncbi:hypothetical protein EKL30_08275 [Candidimonas sp. SYP-B2681]|uniref:hypothetical protein n=1 Tax=Candidimonas sp. SYP-B2681 TaxID=2497686 RepID=UPI000F86FB3F|nr:hypothetical protein [Candidimonas sp. SYP-B2681]RTZ44559.1 hypothetical protein EKL30_08275 [Candidimonas sp. SYP-B2681]
MNQYNRLQPSLANQQYAPVNSRREGVPAFAATNRDTRPLDDELFRSEWRDPVALRFSPYTT